MWHPLVISLHEKQPTRLQCGALIRNTCCCSSEPLSAFRRGEQEKEGHGGKGKQCSTENRTNMECRVGNRRKYTRARNGKRKQKTASMVLKEVSREDRSPAAVCTMLRQQHLYCTTLPLQSSLLLCSSVCLTLPLPRFPTFHRPSCLFAVGESGGGSWSWFYGFFFLLVANKRRARGRFVPCRMSFLSFNPLIAEFKTELKQK